MKKLFLIPLALTLLTSCGSGLEGEGPASVRKEFSVNPFSSLEIYCNCDITLIPSESTKIIVESHQNLIDNLELNSKRNELTLREKKKVGEYNLYNILIYTPAGLNEIELNKQVNFKISGTLKSDKLKFEVNDQAIVSQTYLDIKDLEFDLSDQTHAEITGVSINLEVSSSDESIGNFAGMQAVDIRFEAEDNSSLSLYAMKNLSGKAENNAQVSYKGDPYKNTTEKDRANINKN